MTDHSSDIVASIVGSATGAKRYRPYPAYKDSGVEWLGKIPATWEVKENRWLFRESDARSECGEEELLTVSHISGVTRRADKPDVTMMEAASHEGYKLCGRGDLAINTMWAWMGALGVACEDGMVSPSYNVYCTNFSELVPSYYDYLCRVPTHIVEITRHSKGIWSSRLRLYPDTFRNIRTPVPPKSEQRRITEFLDRTTVKIDRLIAKKERLIELLKEKRTAFITRAVTKGLNPDEPMKDAEVDWLGEIPAHWETIRLKQVADKIGSGKTPAGGAHRYVADGVMLVRSQNVHFGGLELTDVAYIDAATDAKMSNSRVCEEDVLLNITGASLGRCCVARLAGMNANVNQHVCIIRTDQRQCYAAFFAYSLESHMLQDQIFNSENGISRDALNFELVGTLVFVKPPLNEQRSIAIFLEHATEEIDTLISNVRSAIDHLREFRIALVSAAVTGKIDLREAVP